MLKSEIDHASSQARFCFCKGKIPIFNFDIPVSQRIVRFNQRES